MSFEIEIILFIFFFIFFVMCLYIFLIIFKCPNLFADLRHLYNYDVETV